MALDRWIALVLLLFCVFYGYAAFFTMDEGLPPFMKNNPIWPSTFPKMLAGLGVATSLTIVLNLENSTHTAEVADINYRKLTEYKLGQALLLLGLMVVYALALRPVGFLASTSLFLIIGAVILGERRWFILISVSALSTGIVWWLVDDVLGIFLRPLPYMFG